MKAIQRMNPDDHLVSAKELKDVVAFGRKCSKTAFPNPTREGCPERARLRAMAHRDPRLTLEDLPIAHVVRCSPCFQEYLHLRRMSLLVRGLQISAASLVVLALFVTAVLFVKDRIGGRGEPSVSQQKQQRSEPQPNVVTPRPAVPVSPIPIKIDLAAFSPTRGDEKEDSRKKLHLPQKLLRVTLQMPLGMEPGEYLVRLKDSAGTDYADIRALGRINDGTTSVEVDLDLASASPGNFTLMIRPPGLSWRRYPVVVE
jgi:hypothetical protein